MSDWRDYIGDRLIKEHVDGFYVIKPRDHSSDACPLFCPTCEYLMSGMYDVETYEKFGCCDLCAAAWVYPDEGRWRSGWRPSREEVMHKCESRHI